MAKEITQMIETKSDDGRTEITAVAYDSEKDEYISSTSSYSYSDDRDRTIQEVTQKALSD